MSATSEPSGRSYPGKTIPKRSIDGRARAEAGNIIAINPMVLRQAKHLAAEYRRYARDEWPRDAAHVPRGDLIPCALAHLRIAKCLTQIVACVANEGPANALCTPADRMASDGQRAPLALPHKLARLSSRVAELHERVIRLYGAPT